MLPLQRRGIDGASLLMLSLAFRIGGLCLMWIGFILWKIVKPMLFLNLFRTVSQRTFLSQNEANKFGPSLMKRKISFSASAASHLLLSKRPLDTWSEINDDLLWWFPVELEMGKPCGSQHHIQWRVPIRFLLFLDAVDRHKLGRLFRSNLQFN